MGESRVHFGRLSLKQKCPALTVVSAIAESGYCGLEEPQKERLSIEHQQNTKFINHGQRKMRTMNLRCINLLNEKHNKLSPNLAKDICNYTGGI